MQLIQRKEKGNWHLRVCVGGKDFKINLKTSNKHEANRLAILMHVQKMVAFSVLEQAGREEALSTGKVLVLMLKIAAIITIAFVLIAIIGEQLVGE